MQKFRLDVFLFDSGSVRSRQKAKDLILSGCISVNGRQVLKPAFEVCEDDDILISEHFRYVGRGGLKMEKAIKCFSLNLNGRPAIDIGASTGGFTDCMLQHGASKVYALDVGHGQLDETLRSDSRVVNLEGYNVRDIKPDMFDPFPDIITADVSFISLKHVINALIPFITEKTELICLLKPQFEIGKTNKGIVRKKQEHVAVIEDMLRFVEDRGLIVKSLNFSPVTGGNGNIEFLLYIKSGLGKESVNVMQIVDEAHKTLKNRKGESHG